MDFVDKWIDPILSVNLLVSQIQPHPTRCLSALKHFVNLFTKGHIQLSKRNTVFDRLGPGRVLLEMSMLGIFVLWSIVELVNDEL